jgi:hypothetical protein
MDWTSTFFAHRAEWWGSLLEAANNPGHRSYASWQMALYRRLGMEARESFEEALGGGGAAG